MLKCCVKKKGFNLIVNLCFYFEIFSLLMLMILLKLLFFLLKLFFKIIVINKIIINIFFKGLDWYIVYCYNSYVNIDVSMWKFVFFNKN